MHTFDYSFLKEERIPPKLMLWGSLIATIVYHASDKKETSPKIFANLESIAVFDSVWSSNAIEGISTTKTRFKSLMRGDSEATNHPEEEILGYKEALSYIHKNHALMVIDKPTIKMLHKMVMSKSNPKFAGKFKEEPNFIRGRTKEGESFIVHVPVAPNEVDKALDQLILAYRDARDDADINPLTLIPCVVSDFLCIHPFSDGNGRLSRLLSVLLLYKSGFDICRYISFEKQINLAKGSYYDSLLCASDGWHENRGDYMPFVEFYVQMVLSAYQELDKKFVTLKAGKAKKKDRVKEIVLSAILPISKEQIRDLLPDVSDSTIERNLESLIKEGLIKKIGEFKNARYIKIL